MVLSLIDSHCHLDRRYLPDGPDDVLKRAADAGVVGLIVIGVGDDLGPAREAIALAERYPIRIAATVGIHPHDASKLTDDIYEELATLAAHPAVVALGEMGLDYHYDHSPRDVQQAMFARQIALAKLVRKPVVIHTRDARVDTLALLRSEGARDVGGVIHCFSEDREFAADALDLGFDLSFSGIVTFKGAKAIQDVAAWAPLDRILVETDSPYLSPVPFRGKPCEPAYVVHTATKVADLRGQSLEAIAVATRHNTERCFHRTFGDPNGGV